MATTYPQFIDGQLVTQPLVQIFEDGTRTLTGAAIAAIIGNSSANSVDAPLTVTAAGGMTVAVGGAGGQKMFINSASGPRLIDSVKTQTFTVPTANPTNGRRDLICAIYAQTTVNPRAGVRETITGGTATIDNPTIYDTTESVTYQYVTGTASSSPVDPSVPSGYVAIARITVPAAAASIVTGNIAVLLSSMQTLILSGVAGYVDVTTNQTVAGNKTFSGTTTVGGLQLKPSTNTPLTVTGIRTNTAGSILISPGGTGHIVYLGFDDPSCSSIQFGPTSAWGYIDGAGLHIGSSVYGTGATIASGFLHVGPSTGTSGLTTGRLAGDGVFERGDNTGGVFLGNQGNHYLYCDGSQYYMPNAPLLVGGFISAGGSVVIGGASNSVSSSGKSVALALQFANPVSGGSVTSIGSSAASVQGILAKILSVENVSVASLLALDESGNLGVGNSVYAGSLYARGGNLFLGNAGASLTWSQSTGYALASATQGDFTANGVLSASRFIAKGPTGQANSLSFVSPANPTITTDIGANGASLQGSAADNFSISVAGTIKFGIDNGGNVLAGGDVRASNGRFFGSTVYLGASGAALSWSSVSGYTFASGTQGDVRINGAVFAAAANFGSGTIVTTGTLSAANLQATKGAYYKWAIQANASTTTSIWGKVLPGNASQAFQVYARCASNLAPGNNHQIVGTGGNGWSTTVSEGDFASSVQELEILGTAVGGQTIGVNYICGAVSTDGQGRPGVLVLEAWPV